MRELGANLTDSEIELLIKEVVQTTVKQDAFPCLSLMAHLPFRFTYRLMKMETV